MCVFALVLGMSASVSFGQDYSGFNLSPGETLVAVDGVPVSQEVCESGNCGPVRTTIRAVGNIVSSDGPIVGTVRTVRTTTANVIRRPVRTTGRLLGRIFRGGCCSG